MSTLCVYGPKIGHSSLEVVTRGMIEGAIEHGALAGWVPTGRSYDEHDLYRGRDAMAAVVCGGYPEIPMVAYGTHEYRSFMLAANSSWIPDGFWAQARAHLTEILTPSEWSKKQIEATRPKDCAVPVRVVPHGVLNGFKPVEPGETPKVNVCGPPGKFVITHFAGSSAERKGTMELVRAFMSWPRHADAFLFLSLNALQAKPFSNRMVDLCGQDVFKHVAVVPPINGDPETMRWVYDASNVVCQPSRAEGFGLVPVESLCCGVPVVVTRATGHQQWLGDEGNADNGVVPIDVGPARRVDYDPGGVAPSVSVDAIRDALEISFINEALLRASARKKAGAWRERWSWSNQTKLWIEELKERYPNDA